MQEGALSVAQHHDAITGSQRRHVHRDYIRQLAAGQAAVDGSVARVAAALSGAKAPVVACKLLNESSCPAAVAAISADKALSILLLNPLGWTNSHVVRVPLPSAATKVQVSDPAGKPVLSQLLPPWPKFSSVNNKTVTPASPTVAFNTTVAPLGLAAYKISNSKRASSSSYASEAVPHGKGDPLVLENAVLRATFDAQTGLLSALMRKDTGVSVDVKQSLLWYESSDGSDGPFKSKGAGGSGNYIFQPKRGADNPHVRMRCCSCCCSSCCCLRLLVPLLLMLTRALAPPRPTPRR